MVNSHLPAQLAREAYLAGGSGLDPQPLSGSHCLANKSSLLTRLPPIVGRKHRCRSRRSLPLYGGFQDRLLRRQHTPYCLAASSGLAPLSQGFRVPHLALEQEASCWQRTRGTIPNANGSKPLPDFPSRPHHLATSSRMCRIGWSRELRYLALRVKSPLLCL